MVTELDTNVNVAELRGRHLGRVLVKMGLITREQLHEAFEVQHEKGGPLGQILLDLGHIDQKGLTFALAFRQGWNMLILIKLPFPNKP